MFAFIAQCNKLHGEYVDYLLLYLHKIHKKYEWIELHQSSIYSQPEFSANTKSTYKIVETSK